MSICPIGADSSAPSDPAAETMPITVLRTIAGTARAATDMAIALAVQASDAPIRNYDLTDPGLDVYPGFSESDWRAVNRGNAERLFPRLKA